MPVSVSVAILQQLVTLASVAILPYYSAAVCCPGTYYCWRRLVTHRHLPTLRLTPLLRNCTTHCVVIVPKIFCIFTILDRFYQLFKYSCTSNAAMCHSFDGRTCCCFCYQSKHSTVAAVVVDAAAVDVAVTKTN